MEEALEKLVELKKRVAKRELFEKDPSEVLTWNMDPFYGMHRNVAMEMMHEGYIDQGRKLFDDYVLYQYPEQIGEARADLNFVFNGLMPLDVNNLPQLFRQYGGTLLLSDIPMGMQYVNYVIINVREDEQFMIEEDRIDTASDICGLINNQRALDRAYLDVFNTKLNNGSYPFRK